MSSASRRRLARATLYTPDHPRVLGHAERAAEASLAEHNRQVRIAAEEVERARLRREREAVQDAEYARLRAVRIAAEAEREKAAGPPFVSARPRRMGGLGALMFATAILAATERE